MTEVKELCAIIDVQADEIEHLRTQLQAERAIKAEMLEELMDIRRSNLVFNGALDVLIKKATVG